MEPTPGDSQPLSLQDLLDLRTIKNGVDVRNHAQAKRLRNIKARFPELLELGEPAGRGEAPPFFTAITTKAGDAVVAEGLQGVSDAVKAVGLGFKAVTCGA